jgi:dihydroorotate dehydrogenase
LRLIKCYRADFSKKPEQITLAIGAKATRIVTKVHLTGVIYFLKYSNELIKFNSSAKYARFQQVQGMRKQGKQF